MTVQLEPGKLYQINDMGYFPYISDGSAVFKNPREVNVSFILWTKTTKENGFSERCGKLISNEPFIVLGIADGGFEIGNEYQVMQTVYSGSPNIGYTCLLFETDFYLVGRHKEWSTLKKHLLWECCPK